MSDFISRQAAIEAASRGCRELRGTFGRCEDEINKVPAADVVEVVRCKDCKHRPTSIDGATQGFDVDFAWDSLCPCQCDDGWYNWYPPDEWYCPRGEGRTDE